VLATTPSISDALPFMKKVHAQNHAKTLSEFFQYNVIGTETTGYFIEVMSNLGGSCGFVRKTTDRDILEVAKVRACS
jgi:hypothetical protein